MDDPPFSNPNSFTIHFTGVSFPMVFWGHVPTFTGVVNHPLVNLYFLNSQRLLRQKKTASFMWTKPPNRVKHFGGLGFLRYLIETEKES